MKRFLYLFLIVWYSFNGSAQIFDTEAIKISGDNDKRINLIILSDGYQTHELDQFITDATDFTSSMFNQSPFKEYTDYFNVYVIKVPSNESGADHPATASDVDETGETPVFVDTYFNATFDAFGYHRLLYYEIDGNNANNSYSKILSVLTDNFPSYDQALILVNSPIYGGSGGEFPMASTGVSANEVAIHELGHSLFDLKDEYYPGDELAEEAINMTQESNTNLVKWKNWIGSNGVNIYPHGTSGIAASWYKPRNLQCKMEVLNEAFCAVCKEGMIEKIHSLISPIDSYSPNNNETINAITFPLEIQLDLLHTIPNTLETTWTLNGTNYSNNVDSVSILEEDLIEGNNTLTVVVNDATTFLRINNHNTIHSYTVTWSINYSTLGINSIKSEINNFNINLSPNPSNSFVNLKFESNFSEKLKVVITSLDGRKIKSARLFKNQNKKLDIRNLSQGIYFVNFYFKNILVGSKKLIKN